MGNDLRNLLLADFILSEFADFEAFSSGSLVCVKFPSLPNDKVLE